MPTRLIAILAIAVVASQARAQMSTFRLSNGVTLTVNTYSGTINNVENKNDVLRYEVSSVNPAVMTCNGKKYDLGDGTVFHVDANGSLTQVPIVGLKPTMDYVDTLQQYFAANPTPPAALLATEPDKQSP